MTKKPRIAALGLVAIFTATAGISIADCAAPQVAIRPAAKREVIAFVVPRGGDNAFRQHLLRFAEVEALIDATIDSDVQPGGVPRVLYSKTGLVIEIATTNDEGMTAEGRPAMASAFCDVLCVSRLDWSTFANSLAEFLAKESPRPLVRSNSDSDASRTRNTQGMPGPEFRYKPLRFQPSSSELCQRRDVPEPYGLTTACAKVSEDKLRLQWLTIVFGGLSVRVPDDVLAMIDRPRLDRFTFFYEVDTPDQGRSYLEFRIEFGDLAEGPFRDRQAHASRTLVVTIWDAGGRLEYQLLDTDRNRWM
ncbi:MAG: hypothetical protein Q8N51_20675 [Gammaproteobacteria bacterium]|nr:hypothetical protein [Gammaproteobacteria bacterium]